MDHVEVVYRLHPDKGVERYTGAWSPVSGGIVMHVSERTHVFIPFDKIESITQEFAEDTFPSDRFDYGLYSKMKMRLR